MKGYKVFNSDWTCRDFQYKVGQTFEIEGKPECCEWGFHFCEKLSDCFNYYCFNSKNKVAEIEALGDIDSSDESDTKYCTNKIKIIKELTWEEVLSLCNTGFDNEGKNNTGNCNHGDYNCGFRNVGDFNTGYYNYGNHNCGRQNKGLFNSGHMNFGNHNSGLFNYGNSNSGRCNLGHFNSGNYNDGNRNTGDWNKTDYSNGIFNSKPSTIMIFNKPSNWTYEDYIQSPARKILNKAPLRNRYINYEDMTEQEKSEHSSSEINGGYLKILTDEEYEKECQSWWNNLPNSDKNIIKSIPNFDVAIFKEITGIKV